MFGRITPLTRSLVRSRCAEFVTLDAPYVPELLEPWDSRNYLLELPHKWSLSFLVEHEEQVVGYRIASGIGKLPKHAHTHRTAIREDKRRCGLASSLLAATIEAARQLDYEGLTGLLYPTNEASRHFLVHTGWRAIGRIINGNQLWAITFKKS